jgi:hypothetical protein
MILEHSASGKSGAVIGYAPMATQSFGAVPGLAAKSVRVSLDPPTIALAYDPVHTSSADLEKAIQGKLSAKGLTGSALPML